MNSAMTGYDTWKTSAPCDAEELIGDCIECGAEFAYTPEVDADEDGPCVYHEDHCGDCDE